MSASSEACSATKFCTSSRGEQPIDRAAFMREVLAWYSDPATGFPSSSGNYAKYTLWWTLYGGSGRDDKTPPADWNTNIAYDERYACTSSGAEEFAYIGEELQKHPTTTA